jgi:hypothetical protein
MRRRKAFVPAGLAVLACVLLVSYFKALAYLQERALSDTVPISELLPPHRQSLQDEGYNSSHSCNNQKGKAPTFIIAGVQKAGTTALHAVLQTHPQIAKPYRSEMHFFDRHDLVRQNLGQLHNASVICQLRQAYWNTLHLEDDPKEDGLITFEKTPAYMVHDFVPGVISSVVPWTKIIIILRNPIDRLISQFRMRLERLPGSNTTTQDNNSLEEILAKEIKILIHNGFEVPTPVPFQQQYTKKLKPKELRHWKERSMLYRGCYADQLQPWLEHYQLRENLLLLPYEQLALGDILDFVGAKPFNFSESVVSTRYSPVAVLMRKQDIHLRNSTRQYLERFYKECNDKLVDLVGEEWRDIWWK